MGTSATSFTGTSSYSNDLVQVMNRAIAIASLPMQLLQNQETTMKNRASALSSLETKFSSLQSAFDGLSQATSSATANSSNSTVASAAASTGAMAATYTINVLDPGSYSTAYSSNGLDTVSDPSSTSISSSSTFQLTVDGQTYTLNPATNSLNSLADSINSSGAGLQATVVNLGPPSAPDYRLAIQASKLGAVSVSLNAGSTNLLTGLTTGTLASYTVNGLPATPISSDSATVTVAPGVQVNLLSAGTTTVSVTQSSSNIQDALRAFATAYNAAIDELNKHHGDSGGALTGDSLIRTLEGTLRGITQYSGSGAISGLVDLGLDLGKDGKLTFDGSKLSSASSATLQQITTFLGDSSSGFVKAASDALKVVDDATDGTIQLAEKSVADQITEQDSLIAANQDRIDLLQATLTQQMSAADALIAGLESQVALLKGLFSASNS